MPSLGPISGMAISALPDYEINNFSVIFEGEVTAEAVPYSPYNALVNGPGQAVVWLVKLNLKAVR